MTIARRALALLAFGAVLLASAASTGATAVPACMKVSTSSRWVPYGYNHLVVLESKCEKPATCTVSTDVNPQKTTVEVAAGGTQEVTTFMASPSQTFTASVTCTLH